ncbi:uncharacterized protein RJT21DRAFT_123041 [Scheffersomyces amazonensis]|uniref:uncharacterized protein n=1 Tax=Scheffersomyces amazonensis TaxID=1078765 RepID=UPI00315D6735
MGAYIPPPNDRDDSNKDKDKDSNKNNKSEVTKVTPSSASSAGSTTITIPNPANLIPHNPSIGLFFGPFTPASDNLPALYGMVGLQFLIGVGCFRHARSIIRNRNLIPQGRPRSSIFKALIPILGGIVTVFGSGLELARLALPYDPWYEEAKYYRKLATKLGDPPNPWFGAYKLYRPMDLSSWIDRTGRWIKSADEDESSRSHNSFVFTSGIGPDGKVIQVNDPKAQQIQRQKYVSIYNELHSLNENRFKYLLEYDLKDVYDLNKAERIDLILEGKSPYVNPQYTKASIQLGNFSIESDEQFERAWLNFEPWEELKQETEYDIRIITHWFPIVDTEEEQ